MDILSWALRLRAEVCQSSSERQRTHSPVAQLTTGPGRVGPKHTGGSPVPVVSYSAAPLSSLRPASHLSGLPSAGGSSHSLHRDDSTAPQCQILQSPAFTVTLSRSWSLCRDTPDGGDSRDSCQTETQQTEILLPILSVQPFFHDHGSSVCPCRDRLARLSSPLCYAPCQVKLLFIKYCQLNTFPTPARIM